MKSAWVPTGLMGLIAAALGLVAASFYPWPERGGSEIQVNQKLFANLDANQAKSLTITSFDRENRRFDSIQVRRVRDAWVISSAADFPAGNTKRLSDVLATLSDSLILQVKTSDESMHKLFGVIDADQSSDAADQSGFGTKIVLSDNNNRTIAELIVGETVGENPNQRFVRIAGQPNVYVLDLPQSLLSTKFSDWVDHNLLDLKLGQAGAGLEVAGLEIDAYVLDGESVKTESAQKYNYRATMTLGKDAIPLTMAKAGSDGQLGEPKSDLEINPQTLNLLANNLSQIPFNTVGKKPSAATRALAQGLDENSDLSALANFGFRRAKNIVDGLQSKNGQIIVSTTAGVDWCLNFGSVAVNANVADAQINYYLVVTARANEAAFPTPPEPTDKNNEDQQKDYLRAVKRREDGLAAAKSLAKQYNERHAPWLYVISEAALNAMRPSESALTK